MLTQINNENEISENRIRSIEKKFLKNRQTIENRKNLEIQNLTLVVKKAMSMIQELDNTTDFSKFEDNLKRLMRAGDGDTEAMENIWGKSINLFFVHNTELFEAQMQNAKEDFEKVIQRRVMTIFTREDDIVSDDDSRIDVAIKLAEKGVRSLCERQKSLVSYQISVFRNDKLVSQEADKYYDNGRIGKSIMVVPVVKHIPYLEGTKERVSLLLAHEINFEQDNKGADTIKGADECGLSDRKSQHEKTKPTKIATGSGNKIIDGTFKMTDMERGLEWLVMPSKECRIKAEYEGDLLPGFKLPTIQQLLSLKTFLNNTKRKEIRMRMKPLLKRGRNLWSRKPRSVFEEEFAVFNLLSGKSIYDPSDACNFAVGVRLFGG